jgi:pyruvate dehydrogenase (quinone)
MTHRVADELVSRLVEAGVKRIYAIVGDSLNPVTDAVRRNGMLQWATSVMRKRLRSPLAPKRS